MNETLRRLTAVYGPSGRESAVAAAVSELIGPYVEAVRTDALGNLIAGPAAIAPGAQPLMLSAHLDQGGLVVTEVGQDGRLRFSVIGGLSPVGLPSLQVASARGAIGVVGVDEGVDAKDLAPSKMFIDLGVAGREAAAGLSDIGDVFCLTGELAEVGETLVGPALDNRAGCAVLIEVARRLAAEPHSGRPPVQFVFSVQGAVAPRGVRTAAYALEPAWALAVDVTAVGGSRNRSPVELGKGPAIRVKDASYVAPGPVRQRLEAAARKAEVATQTEVLPPGEGQNEAAGAELARAGVLAGMVGLPARHLGTASEMVHRSDLDAAVHLLLAVIDPVA